jgi:hypothetical protein
VNPSHLLQDIDRAPQPEVVDPHRVSLSRRDLIGALVDDLGPEMLERRHDIGERNRAGAEKLDPGHAVPIPHCAIEGQHGPRVARQLIDPLDVGHGPGRAPDRAVGSGERVGKAGVKRAPPLLPVSADQRRAEVIAPIAGRLNDLRLDGQHVVIGRDAIGTVHDVVDADQNRFG